MDLVYSVAILSVATVLWVVVILAARNPVKPAWAPNWLADDLGCVAVTALIGFGGSFGVSFVFNFKSQPIGLVEIALAAGIASVCYLVVRLMAPRRRLAEYASQLAERTGGDSEASTAGLIQLAPSAAEGQPPHKPTLPKAA
jgi:hypothetical protein